MAEIEAMDDACGQRDDILEGTTEFDASNVVIRIDAERRGRERTLDRLGE